MGEDQEHKQRIKVWMAFAMVITALSFDGFNALLNLVVIGEILSSIISPVATFGFIIWFWLQGVTFIKSPKKLAAMGGQALIGLIPIINTLPELTLGVLVTIILTRSEDKGGLLSKATGMASPLTGKRSAIAGYGRQFAGNAENLRQRFGNMRLAPKTIGNLRSGGYGRPEGFRKFDDKPSAEYGRPEGFGKPGDVVPAGYGRPDGLAPKTVFAPSQNFEEKSGRSNTINNNASVPKENIMTNNVLDLSGASVPTENSVMNRAPLASAPMPDVVSGSAGIEINRPSPIMSSMESFDQKPSIAPEVTAAPLSPSLSGKIEDTEYQEESLDTYLDQKVYSNLGISSRDEETALSLETSEGGREILRRSFENCRNSLSTIYKMETVDGRVDEYALTAEQKKRQAEVLYPVLEKSFGGIAEKMRQGGVELSLKDVDISQDDFDFNSYDRKLRNFGDKFEESVQTKIGERIAQTLSSGQSYKGLSPLTAEEQSDRATRRKWERAFGQIVSEEYSEFLEKSQINYDEFRRQVNDDISKTNSSLPIISRDKYRVKTDREQLTGEILEEYQKAKNTGFLNSNISASSLKKVLEGGQFKDVFSMTPEELSKVAGGTRAFESYLEKRYAIEKGLGAREKGDETIVYGTFASDINNENIQGGASQYGDIFIKFKKGTRATYTESDSMAPRDSELVASKPREIDNSVEARLSEAANDAKSRQVATEHTAIAKALLSHDLKRMAKMRGQSDSDLGRHYAYLEAQIINPTFDDIDSINIPKTALAKAGDEEKEFLENLSNNPKWQGKVNFI
jgi:hypothetical protein